MERRSFWRRFEFFFLSPRNSRFFRFFSEKSLDGPKDLSSEPNRGPNIHNNRTSPLLHGRKLLPFTVLCVILLYIRYLCSARCLLCSPRFSPALRRLESRLSRFSLKNKNNLAFEEENKPRRKWETLLRIEMCLLEDIFFLLLCQSRQKSSHPSSLHIRTPRIT